jgi:hypothetical protein
MILKGNQRGGGQNLAAHLMNEQTNDHVEILDLRGAIAPDLSGAFAEWHAQSKVTKGKKYLFSLSVNPDIRQGDLTREQYLDIADRTERKLKLSGQGRAIVMHIKKDDDGIPRQHAHIVWSRTDTDNMKFVHMSEFKLKLRAVARDFAKDYGLALPRGMQQDGLTDRFQRKAAGENLHEKQQEERTGLKKPDRMADITEIWNTHKDGHAFVEALAAKGYFLAQGNRIVIVDLAGEVHALARQIKVKGMRTAQITERLTGLTLPTLEAARQNVKDIRDRLPRKTPEGPTADHQREALKQKQDSRRSALESERKNLISRQAKDRGQLAIMHASENAGILASREKKPSKIAAFLMRVTGIQLIFDAKNRRAHQVRDREQTRQRAALARRHKNEAHHFDRAGQALTRIDRRERNSLEIALQRQEFERIIDRDRGAGKAPDIVIAPLPVPKIPKEKKQTPLRELFARVAKDIEREKQKPKDSLRAAFDNEKAETTAEPEKPEKTDGLAGQFRRAAEDKDPDRDKKPYRRAQVDYSLRR